MSREKIVCQCGHPLSRPLPKQCPGCHATLTGIRRPWWPAVVPVVSILLLFSIALLYALWLTGAPLPF
ncbi:MAG: hypothetical protein QGG36_32065 [Pirellulaceae bacterium]|jgi:hypothetical protein|nr:hypothetical protein [Pirellulaceae bacterium]MDP7020479.1 hypothetical protein [Pirellulaceae bacterium]